MSHRAAPCNRLRQCYWSVLKKKNLQIQAKSPLARVQRLKASWPLQPSKLAGNCLPPIKDIAQHTLWGSDKFFHPCLLCKPRLKSPSFPVPGRRRLDGWPLANRSLCSIRRYKRQALQAVAARQIPKACTALKA